MTDPVSSSEAVDQHERNGRGLSQGSAPWIAAGLLAFTLILAYAGKVVCMDTEPGFWGVGRYCYSDVRVLWSFRGFDVDAVPYAGAPEGYVEDYTYEYPPGMGLPAYLIGLATDSRRSFFDLNALTFVIAAAVTLWQLDNVLRAMGRSRWRLLGFALSPGLVLFGMLNWDLWAVVFVALGLAAAARGRPTLAGAWFGIGASVKWWPAILVIVLVVGPWSRRRAAPWRAGAANLAPAAVAAGVWALVQLPAIAISPSGWWASVRFQLTRPPNLDSVWAAFSGWAGTGGSYDSVVTWLSLIALGAVAIYVALRLDRGDLDPGDAALALVGAYLLTGKVFSPQFIVWLLPVAVIARVNWLPVLATEAANALVWALFGVFMGSINDPRFVGFLGASQGITVVRAAMLAWVVVAALLPRQQEADQQERDAYDHAATA